MVNVMEIGKQGIREMVKWRRKGQLEFKIAITYRCHGNTAVASSSVPGEI